MNSKKKKIFVVILVVIGLVVTSVLLYFNNLKPLQYDGEEKLVEIPAGYSLFKVANLLQDAHLIRDDLSLQIYAYANGYGGEIKAGKYILSPSYSVAEIVKKMSEGETVEDHIILTVPEGWNLTQIGEALEENNVVTKEEFLKEAGNVKKYQEEFSFLSSMENVEERTLEGYLFPDTYYLRKEDSAEDIIRKMLSRFDEVIKPEYVEQADSLGMTLDKIVILASIVEQETKHEIDRPKVAKVFYNRLEKDMPLQSDITVLYALGSKKEQVLYKDLQIDSKYNTYKYKGLPIGPVGSFSESSLKATLYPDDNSYLYFLAKTDGYCVYNETFEEHKADVKKYLR